MTIGRAFARSHVARHRRHEELRGGFVAFDEHWCWEHPDIVLDDVRYIDGPKRRQRSVSLVPVFEGLEFDLVISRSSAGQHKMRSATAMLTLLEGPSIELLLHRTLRIWLSHHRGHE